MEVKVKATVEMVRQFAEWFVNRRAYTVQSMKPHPESGPALLLPADRERDRSAAGADGRRHECREAVVLSLSVAVILDTAGALCRRASVRK